MGKTQGSTTWHGRYTRRDHDRALNTLLKDIKRHPDPQTGRMTIEHRRRRALWALQQYALAGQYGADDTATTLASDLLADLLHLNDAGMVNFAQALDMARIHHTEEAR